MIVRNDLHVIPLIRIEVYRLPLAVEKLHGIPRALPELVGSAARVLILKIHTPGIAREVRIVPMVLDAPVIREVVINEIDTRTRHAAIARRLAGRGAPDQVVTFVIPKIVPGIVLLELFIRRGAPVLYARGEVLSPREVPDAPVLLEGDPDRRFTGDDNHFVSWIEHDTSGLVHAS